MAEQILMRLRQGGCALCDPPSRPATSITNSVGTGGQNIADDVRTIQSALNAKAPADGGPIAKLSVDGLIGPRTIAAIQKYQTRHLGWADGRIDPDGPTIHAINAGSGGAPQKGGAAPAPAPMPALPKATAAQNKSFIEKIGKLLPRARHWVQSAQLRIDMASDFARKGRDKGNDPFHDIGKSDLALFHKYFHAPAHKHATQLQQLNQARQIYQMMQTVMTSSLLEAPMFGWGVGHFQSDPADGTLASKGYVAYTFYGGWHARRKDGTPRLSGDDNYAGDGTLRQDTIFFPVGQLLTLSDNYLTETIVHELAHFVGPGVKNKTERIADHTYDTDPNFLKVSNDIAMHTAECYGYFAAEAGLRKLTIPIP